ncbi:MAG: ABC transporter permease [Chloroflexota bacterium]|nr:ABC transporter permease [Chloroflexota bacterium]
MKQVNDSRINLTIGRRPADKSKWQIVSALARKHPTGTAGVIVMFIIIVISVIAPVLATDHPYAIDTPNRLSPPSRESYFGTDQVGRDVYSRTIYGGRISLLIGSTVALVAVFGGAAIGIVAGYNRRLDVVIMRVMDGIMAFPGILLAISIMAVLGASVLNVIIALSIGEIPGISRVARSTVLSLREQPFVDSARAIGARPIRILVTHIFPNIIPSLVVMGTFGCAAAMLSEAGLSFLGAGVPPDNPSWGNVMAESRGFLHIAVWVIFYPGLVLAIFVTSLNVAGDTLRDILDPKLRRNLK